MKNRLPACRCILSLFILLSIVIFPIERALAHWIQTHQKVTSLSRDAISKAGRYKKICDFLDTTVVDQKDGIRKTYLRSIMEGLRDADLRANGLYKVECHQWNPCWDWDLKKTDLQCYPAVLLPNVKPDLCNSIADWPVGDHGYNPMYSNVSRGKRQKENQDNLIPYILEPRGSSKEYRKNRARFIRLWRIDPENL